MTKFFSPDAIKSAMELKARDDDVLLCSYPKSGTNWTEQIILLLRNKGKPITDGLEHMLACPFVEMIGADAVEKQESPRFYKMHFDYQTMPQRPEAKYIVVIRNPKDTLISMYHFLNTDVHGHQGGRLESFFEHYITGDIPYGSYFDHLLSWYEHRNDPNVLFLYYEKMKRDIKSSIMQMADFLGEEYRNLVQDQRVLEDVIHYSSFEYMKEHMGDAMDSVYRKYGFSGIDVDATDLPSGLKYSMKFLKNRPAKNGGNIGMIRKGVVGDGKVTLTSDMNDRMDEEIEKRLRDTEMYQFWKSISCI